LCAAAPTYAYQDKLPSLPVPSLEETLAKYLRSLQPFEMLGACTIQLCRSWLTHLEAHATRTHARSRTLLGIFSPEEMKRTRALADEFKADGGRGQRLHSKLVARSQQRRNWLEEWWYAAVNRPDTLLALTSHIVVIVVRVRVRVRVCGVRCACVRAIDRVPTGSSTRITSGAAPRR
jgi:hypothetical protein